MRFVDSCQVDVIAGKGGNGAIAFRRERFIPFGGPSGGDGGRGGDVVFVADEGLSTLADLTYARTLRAESGEQGHGKDMYGRGGEDLIVRVPVGTQVFDRETDELLFDVDHADTRVIAAKGGKGGRGNIHFATPYDRAPRRAEPGEPGEERKLRLELKVMADVGLLGFPNVGKSTFIRAVSRARPKVAEYPFTTLTPHLGVVRIGDEATMVIADIPGLIPGAAEGAGLGHRFLKHVERTRALLHLVTLDYGEERDPVSDYEALMSELERFDPELAKRPQVVAMTKADLTEVREAYEGVRAQFADKGIDLRLVSAVTGEGARELAIALYELVKGKSAEEDWAAPQPASASAPPAPAAPSEDWAPLEEGEPLDAKEAFAAIEPPEETPPAEEAAPAAERVTAKKAPDEKAADRAPAKKRAAKKTAAKVKKTTPKKTATKAKAKAKADKTAAKKTAAKKAKADKTAAKKTAAKKTAAKKTAAKKTAAKKATAKAKKTAAKKTAAKAKKATAKAKAPAAKAKKTAAKAKAKVPAVKKRAAKAKTPAPKKTAAKKTAAKKTAAKKTAAKKTTAKKTAAKKTAAKAKAPAPKKTAAKKTTAKKTAAKKTAAKRAGAAKKAGRSPSKETRARR